MSTFDRAHMTSYINVS